MIAAAEPVKIALPVNSLESMPIYIAQDKGLFKKHGVEIDVITSRGGGEAMKAYIAGEVQIVATGFPEVGLMRARGVDVELFFAQTSRVPFALIGRKDLDIKSVADLKGKTIAVTSPGSLTANLARYFVMQSGLDPERDVSLVSVAALLGIPQLGQLFTTGFQLNFFTPIIAGIVLCLLVAAVFDGLIQLAVRFSTPWERAVKRR